MTDNEIIKAWECCTSERTNSCFKCPHWEFADNLVKEMVGES